jgi:hypothetical protein
MTINDAQIIFSRGTLTFNDTKVFFDGNGLYHLIKNQIPVSGTYEFVRLSGKVYLRTKPAILENMQDLQIEIFLAGNLLTIEKEL